ncbi:hypothetical protein Bca4012_037075 [Brassica carinata]
MSSAIILLYSLFLLASPSSSSSYRHHHHHHKPSGSPPLNPSSSTASQIRLACNATRYPDQCLSSLSKPGHVPPDPNPPQIIHSAISEPGTVGWVTVKNQVHAFQATDRSHRMNKEIQTMLSKLRNEMEAEGYKPDPKLSLYDLEEEEKAAEESRTTVRNWLWRLAC